MFNPDQYYSEAVKQLYLLSFDLIGDGERNKDLEKTSLYQLIDQSYERKESSKFFLQICDMEIEADKALLFNDQDFITWGLVTLCTFMLNDEGQAIKFDDKELDFDDLNTQKDYKDYLAEFWPGISYEDLINDYEPNNYNKTAIEYLFMIEDINVGFSELQIHDPADGFKTEEEFREEHQVSSTKEMRVAYLLEGTEFK